MLNTASAQVRCDSEGSPKNGTTPISNDTVAVRGMANKGPIDK